METQLTEYTEENYRDHTVAYGGRDGDYSNSGFFILFDPKAPADKAITFATFSHCSCYGTWEGAGLQDPVSVDEMVRRAKGFFDHDLPGRKMSEDDYDYGPTVACYAQFLEWAKEKGHLE